MTPINQPKLLLSACIVLLLAATAIILPACKKSEHKEISSEFDAAAAKEWYYGTFKKSAEWAMSESKGKKLPDWKNGTYTRIGDLEIVEFPLKKAAQSIQVPSDPSVSISDRKRIAEASLTRIAFVKTPSGNIVIREIDFIPEWAYLKKAGYDISHNTMLKLDTAYAGRIILKQWDGKELKRWLCSGGKRVGRGVLKPIGSTPNEKAAACVTYQICLYERQCSWEIVGDALEYVCEEWISIGFCWQEEVCDEEGDCSGSTDPATCACAVYGACDDDGGEWQEPPCSDKYPSAEEVMDGLEPASDAIGSFGGSTTIDPATGQHQKEEFFKWECGIHSLLSWKWRFISIEKEVTELTNHVWRFVRVTHETIQMDGIPPPYVTVTHTTGSGTFNFFNDRTMATGEVTYTVSVKINCPFTSPATKALSPKITWFAD